MTGRPLALTDSQLALVNHAAASLPQSARDQFLHDLAQHLAGQPSDGAVTAAINSVLDRSLSSHLYCCDSKPNDLEN